MKILVTGGAGFIGSHFVKKMVKAHEVVSFDRFSYAGRIERLNSILDRKNLTVMWGDLASPINEWQAEKMGDVNVIVHFAAETMVDQSLQRPYPFVLSNLFGTYHLLEYARTLKNLKRVVIVSTDEVYGSIKEGFFKETDAFNPGNPYAATKAGADLLAQSYANSFGLPITITRTANNFGPWQHAEKVIPTAIRHALKGTEMTIYGDGKHQRCWLYVEDFADGIEFLLSKRLDGAFHIAGAVELENIELVRFIESEIGKEIRKKFVPDDLIRRGHDRRYGIDATKIKEAGFTPKTTFQKAIQETVRWYLNNPSWLDPRGSSLDR